MLLLAIGATITGDVIDAQSHWTRGNADGGDAGDRIVTEATVHTPDGDVVVTQLGGSVGGIGMRSWPAPELLVPGMRVQLDVHDAADLSARVHHVVDGALVLARPGGGEVEHFVRTGPTKAGHYLYWESGCIFLTLDPAGTKAVPFDMVQAVVTASIQAWSDGTAACGYIQIMQQPAPSGTTTLEVGKDYMNVLKFRDASWCRPATDSDPARCYSDAAAGITTAIYVDDASSDRDGAILDADIEINDVDFAVAIDGMSNSLQTCQAELQNTLTHELGHLQGLEHTCRVPGDPDRVDNHGSAVPLCTDTTDPEILGATMYPFQDCGETTKETLEDDDVNGVCAIYPTASDPGTCDAPKPPGGGGCSTGGGAGGMAAAASVLAALTLRRRRR